MLTETIKRTSRRIAVVSMLAVPLTSQAQTPQEVARRAFDSVVLIATNDARGLPVSLGSGFIVKDGIVATNLHVLEGAATGYAKPVGRDTRHQILGTLAVDETHDLALLKIEGLTGAPLALCERNAAAVGDSVYAVGNPKGLEGTFSQGIVSGVRTVGSESILQITAPISPGSSGGPVLNSEGRVIGVSAATFLEGQNLNFAIPASYLRTLMQAPEKLTPLAGRFPRGKSILRGLGADDNPPVIGSHFMWLSSDIVEWYNFTIRNNLRQPVRSVDVVVIFLDKDNVPVASDSLTVPGPVPPMLAVRSEPRSSTPDIRALCSTAEIRIIGFEVRPETSTDPTASQRHRAKGLVFEIPGDWVPEKSPVDVVGIEPGRFRLPRAPGETKDYHVSVIHFDGGIKQDSEDHMTEWAKAFGRDPKAVIQETLNSGDLRISIFDLSGRFTGFDPRATPLEDYRVLGATVEGKGGPWFVRTIGPESVISRTREGFMLLVRSIRRE